MSDLDNTLIIQGLKVSTMLSKIYMDLIIVSTMLEKIGRLLSLTI